MALDDSYSKALLHMDGADASTTFTDESGKTWTAAATAQIDTAQSVFGGASGLFDGNSDYISTPDHADWRLDGGSNSNTWTIDFRVRFNGDPSTHQALVSQCVDANNYWYFDQLNATTMRFEVKSSGSAIISIDKTFDPADATWYHIALVKNGTSGYMLFVNGTQSGTPTTDTDVIPDFNAILTIGRTVTSGFFYLNGWIDEFRLSKGIARWTANFTPPSYAYGTDVGGGQIFWWG